MIRHIANGRWFVFAGALLVMAGSITGCDRFYGPKLRNSYDFDVVARVTYSNDQTTAATWPACNAAFFGKAGVAIETITIEKGGAVRHAFSSLARS